MASSSPSELALDCKPHSYSMLLKSVGGKQSDQTFKLEEFLSRLEEERLKIDAFKRELPLCMQLLTNAMEASKQQLEAFRGNQGMTKPILEEFIPVKQLASSTETMEKTTNNNNNVLCDKANWMTSAQLWSQTSEGTKQQNSTNENIDNNIGFNISSPKHRNGGGAFLPFTKERNNNSSSCQVGQGLLPELALVSSQKEVDENKKHVEEAEKREKNEEKGSPQTNSSQTHRKARRCWSPDLHRRFVNALQMLGGSQVATPKQIRELMKVDGLTNDEVKSHLQKYRLHTRRPSPSAQTGGAPPAQLVVLGGIWVPQEYATGHTGGGGGGGTPTIYGAHPSSHHVTLPHYCTAPPGQEYYTTTAPPPHQMHHVYKTTMVHGQSSAETGGDGLESIENGKSESSSWKEGSSSENDGERKSLSNFN